jgi:chromate transport protein ChrA
MGIITSRRGLKIIKINWSQIDKKSLAYYTVKWFFIWTGRIMIIGLFALCVLLYLFGSASNEANKKQEDEKKKRYEVFGY